MDIKHYAERYVRLLYGYYYKVQLVDFSIVCKFGYAKIEDIRTAYNFYVLFELVSSPSGQASPIAHIIQTYKLEQSARIAFVALTELT